MSEDLLTSLERLETLLRENRRYQPEAYNFVYEALDWTLHHLVEGPAEPGRHVGCRELLEGIRQFAIQKFGLLAWTVFSQWGVTRTDDWGEIVFNLIDYDLMGRQESDHKEDFSQVYDFSDAFNIEPTIEQDDENGEWDVTYRPGRRSREPSRIFPR